MKYENEFREVISPECEKHLQFINCDDKMTEREKAAYRAGCDVGAGAAISVFAKAFNIPRKLFNKEGKQIN